jgi:methanogenic corrinoid protein MtbC1
MAKKSVMRTTIDSQRNIIEVLRAENERLMDILKRNGINVDTKLPDWMGQKPLVYTKKREPNDPIAIWGI